MVALIAVMCVNAFARTGDANKRYVDFEDLDITAEQMPVIMESKVVVAAASILTDEIANVVMDNSGNYTFFKKQGSSSGDVEDRAGLTMLIKGLGGMEKFEMKDYDEDKIETYYYGAVLGLDTDRKYSDSFDATYGVFASYVGSDFKDRDFDDNKINFRPHFEAFGIGISSFGILSQIFTKGVVQLNL